MKNFRILAALLCIVMFSFCETSPVQKKSEAFQRKYSTQNVVVVIMDGARFSETFGDASKRNIPYLRTFIAPQGVTDLSFYNDGPTYTLAGHTAIATGYYQEINNSGHEYPLHPSFFQYYERQSAIKGKTSWVVASKDKISILSNTTDPAWEGEFRPAYDCGTDGSGTGSGYRNDSLTCLRVLQILNNDHPRMMLVNFQEPDGSGHSGVWADYLNAIEKTDKYIYDIWKFIQKDKFYKGNTAFIVTNDHGRHADGFNGGFSNHGCSCDGCRHVMFVAVGPDFKQSAVINQRYDLLDISATIAEIMGFDFPCNGHVMQEILK
jgi:predicted AlkP superfamily pyrophosphatase or phosphodiesterase